MTPTATLPESLESTLVGMEEYYLKTYLPWVTLAYAQSIDGSIAAHRGASLALSNPASLEITHHLRSRHDAILIGIGTLLADNPRLNVRLVPGDDPQPVVLDNQLRTPLDSRLLIEGATKPWIMTSSRASKKRAKALTQAGARIFRSSPGRVKLPGVLQALGGEGIRSIMVEGGAKIITAFLQSHLANGIVITISPLLVGGLHAIEQPLLKGIPFQKSSYNIPTVVNLDASRLGDDLLVWGHLQWAAPPDV